MQLFENDILGHQQVYSNSCVPMSVELVLKLIKLMPYNDFSFQNDNSKIGHSDWIQIGFKYPFDEPQVEFKREFKLKDNPKYKEDRGSDFFSKYINLNYKQFFLGNTEDNLNLLKTKLISKGYDISNFQFLSLPFKDVTDFDYHLISVRINEFKPDIVWVSLGAPKQERFIGNLFPYLEKGILIAIGASINFYIGNNKNKRAPKWLRILNLEWLFRLFKEPAKTGKRASNYLLLLPKMIFNEMKNQYSKNETTSKKRRNNGI